VDNVTLKLKIVAAISNKKWTLLDHTDLDIGFISLTPSDKNVIIDSLKNSDDKAKSMIKQKLQDTVSSYANNEADKYIAQGFIPIADMDIFLQ
jgi:hypothetical protein